MTDLGLDIRTSGRTAIAVEGNYVRDLLPSDLALLSAPRDVKAPALVKIRDSHHALARYLAMGLPSIEIQCLTGYSGSRISILKSDPTFQELVEHYRKDMQSAFGDFQDRASVIALEALAELQEKMHNDELSPALLLETVKIMADRTGNGPATKNTQVNVNVNLAGRLEAARRRIGATTSTGTQLGQPRPSFIEAPPLAESE